MCEMYACIQKFTQGFKLLLVTNDTDSQILKLLFSSCQVAKKQLRFTLQNILMLI